MFKKSYTEQELKDLLNNITPRRGWDFSSMNTQTQPTPWDYLNIVALYLKPQDHVLDVGTGGGEKFISLSKLFKFGIGVDIDPEMVKIAQENARAGKIKNISFYQDSAHLNKTQGKFNVILCRHAAFVLKTFYEHLKPKGYFIIQEVGETNMFNIKREVNKNTDIPAISKEEFKDAGFKLVAFMEYNVEYIVKDVKSLVFWLQALDTLHADLSGKKLLKNVDTFNKMLDGNVDKRGFVTNEHRYLVVAQK